MAEFWGHESGGSLHTCKIKSYRLGWNIATEKVRIFRGKIIDLNFSQVDMIRLNILIGLNTRDWECSNSYEI